MCRSPKVIRFLMKGIEERTGDQEMAALAHEGSQILKGPRPIRHMLQYFGTENKLKRALLQQRYRKWFINTGNNVHGALLVLPRIERHIAGS